MRHMDIQLYYTSESLISKNRREFIGYHLKNDIFYDEKLIIKKEIMDSKCYFIVERWPHWMPPANFNFWNFFLTAKSWKKIDSALFFVSDNSPKLLIDM